MTSRDIQNKESNYHGESETTKVATEHHFRCATIVGGSPKLRDRVKTHPKQELTGRTSWVDEVELNSTERQFHSSCTISEAKSGGWTDPKLTVLSLYYPVGPSQIRLKQHLLKSTLHALRDLFRKLSLHVNYQNSPISATCQSMDQVEFEVTFFACRINPNEEIIVEVSQVSGASMSYHTYARSVMNTLLCIKNGRDESCARETPVSTVSTPCFWEGNVLRQADTIMGQGSVPTPPDIDDSLVQALETILGFLMIDRYDAQRLGMESLKHMTDPYSSGLSVARKATKCLFFPRTETQQRISQGLLEKACCDATYDGNSNESTQLADLALVVIAQALQVAADSNALDMSKFYQDCKNGNLNLIESMLSKINDITRDPHRAYFAIQSLVALCRCVPAVRTQIMCTQYQHRNVLTAVEAAQIFGNNHHLALATASHQLLLCLQQA